MTPKLKSIFKYVGAPLLAVATAVSGVGAYYNAGGPGRPLSQKDIALARTVIKDGTIDYSKVRLSFRKPNGHWDGRAILNHIDLAILRDDTGAQTEDFDRPLFIHEMEHTAQWQAKHSRLVQFHNAARDLIRTHFHYRALYDDTGRKFSQMNHEEQAEFTAKYYEEKMALAIEKDFLPKPDHDNVCRTYHDGEPFVCDAAYKKERQIVADLEARFDAPHNAAPVNLEALPY